MFGSQIPVGDDRPECCGQWLGAVQEETLPSFKRSRAGDIMQDREIIQCVGPDLFDQLCNVLLMNPEPCGIADGKSMQP